jgi:hypothetical protein
LQSPSVLTTLLILLVGLALARLSAGTMARWAVPAIVVELVIGFVLGNEGGALPVLAGLAKWYAGAAAGNGRQLVSWIHAHDMDRIFLRAVEDRHHGDDLLAVEVERHRPLDGDAALDRGAGVVEEREPGRQVRFFAVFSDHLLFAEQRRAARDAQARVHRAGRRARARQPL